MLPAVLAGAGIASSLLGKKKQKKAVRLQRQLTAMQADRARKLAVKEYRLAKAAAISQVSAAGADDSSAIHGISGSLQSQIQANLENSFQEEALGGQISKEITKANNLDFLSSALSVGAGIAGAARPLRSVTPTPPKSNVKGVGGVRTPNFSTIPLPDVNLSPFIPLGGRSAE